MKIGFWTPILSENKLVNQIETYFFFKGCVAIVMPGYQREDKSEGVFIENRPLSFIGSFLKILSYFTLALPLFILLLKLFERHGRTFYVCKRVLSNGHQAVGNFTGDALNQGIIIQKDKIVFVSPTLVLKDRYTNANGYNLNFVEGIVEGKKGLFPVQQKNEPNAEYVLRQESLEAVLWEIMQLKNRRYRESPLQEVLKYPGNVNITIESFSAFLFERTPQGIVPIDLMDEKLLLEVLLFAKTKNYSLGEKITPEIFYRWVGFGNLVLVQTLFAMNPNVIRHKHQFLTKAILGGSMEEFEFIDNMMKAHRVVKTESDEWMVRVLKEDVNFTKEEFTRLPQELQDRIFRVANLYVQKSMLQKLREFGMYQSPSKSLGINPITCDMDVLDIEKSIREFLMDMRRNKMFLKESELGEKSQYHRKPDGFGRVLGRNFLERTAKEMGLDYIKVPMKMLVLPDNLETLSLDISIAYNNTIYIKAPLVQMYAEPIQKTADKIGRDKIVALLDFIQLTGVSDLCCNNFFMGRNTKNELGIYFIDTEYKTFSFRVGRRSLEYFKTIIAPEDYDWFHAELTRRFITAEAGVPPTKRSNPNGLSEFRKQQLLRYGFTGRKKPIEISIKDIISS